MLWEPDKGTPGAHWAAQRIPDDEAFVGANRSRIGVIDFNDKENFMYSTDITKLPKEMGWWSITAGHFGSPTRWGVKGDQKPGAIAENRHDWERSIALFRCSYSFVSQSRSWLPDPVVGVIF